MFDLSVPVQLTAALGPDLILMVGAMVLLLWAAWRPDSLAHQRRVGLASMVVAALSLAAVVWYIARGESATLGPIAVDNFRWLVDVVILLGTIAALALAIEDNERQGIAIAEMHVLILLASSGMMLLAAARDLMIVFLGIELMSVSSYALAGINRRSPRGAEGALKYFLLGAFSSAFLLYGIALVYGATGSTNVAVIGERIAALGISGNAILTVGIAMLIVGFGFKVSAVPFHMWAPDVYDGAPTSVTAYMAATVKAAAFASFLRVWLEAFPPAFQQWYPAVAMVAILTMVVGNAVGLVQRNLKRLLAYSSIGHAGYLMVALASPTVDSSSALIFYLLAYTLATYGAFAIIITLTRPGAHTVTTEEISGLWRERPGLAVAMVVFMLSLMGFPLFGGAGFLAKWYVVKVVLQAAIPQTTLAVLLVLTSVLAAGYYLYVVMVMFMKPRPEGLAATAPTGALTRAVLVTAA
ncbi:MAG TPA: NADH-quinone oxidoreductase subunit N, partial [Gemmatimonadaceae bacterium]|nr:NADH-quinone oxidoreductase subunit N [Gemmatimonadaceae bacterium]